MLLSLDKSAFAQLPFPWVGGKPASIELPQLEDAEMLYSEKAFEIIAIWPRVMSLRKSVSWQLWALISAVKRIVAGGWIKSPVIQV